MARPSTVEEYIEALPPEQRDALEELRRAVREALPDAEETISYRMPVYKVDGVTVIWIAAYRDHVSLYPATDRVRDELGDDVKPYLSGKGTIRFKADQPLPRDLVGRVVEIRIQEGSPYRR